jgi:alpha-galactosidase
LDGDLTLLKQAMLHDPLIGAVCNPEEVWRMTDEMLVAQAEWLPQYANEIDGAKRRLAEFGPRDGSDGAGAARIPTRSIEEIRASGEQVQGTPLRG